MPRQATLDAPGVLQHVMARGIERRKIFTENKDRASFLERFTVILEETQTQWTQQIQESKRIRLQQNVKEPCEICEIKEW